MVDDKQWSNVIIGPWTPKETLKGGKTRDQIIAEEMSIVDSLSEKVMVQLIQTLKDNQVRLLIGVKDGKYQQVYTKMFGRIKPQRDDLFIKALNDEVKRREDIKLKIQELIASVDFEEEETHKRWERETEAEVE